MNNSLKSVFQTFSLLLVACLLAACAAQPYGRSARGPALTPQGAADQAAADTDYARAADLYQRAADTARSADQRRQLLFEAGLAAAQAGNTPMAKRLLGGIDLSTLSDQDRQRYELARTEVQIADLAPAEALTHLPQPASGTPPEVAERVWQKRATLYFAQNDIIEGIHNLVQRGVWLTDPDALQSNDNTIYDKALDAVAYGQGPDSRVARNADATTRGWLALAAIGQRRWAGRADRDRALAEWENRYPRHPATRSVLGKRFNYASSSLPAQNQPGQQQPGRAPRPTSDVVALALPLTGNFSSAAEAIRDGFMFAYDNDQSSPSKPLIYDSGNLSAADILEQARRDHVGILVGPLEKAKVTEMATTNSNILDVALNYAHEGRNRPGFYQFALSPEDEARTVARHAAAQGYTRALALVPKGDWGDRNINAFRDQFTSEGGQLVDYASYDASQHDHRDAIQGVLRSYKNSGDIDFIFVAAQPSQGRQIHSQLRYYHATGLPMLSTSQIYTGIPDPGSDIDLNGVGFAEVPWVIGEGNTITRRRAAAEQQFGDIAKRYKRLFAMGMDAWLLADRIAGGGLRTGDRFEGMTGVLSVAPDDSVHRYLGWAVFNSGQPQLVAMPSLNDVDSSRPNRRQNDMNSTPPNTRQWERR